MHSGDHPSRPLASAFALALTFFCACNNGSDHNSPATGATVDILITDAPVDDLLSLNGNVQSVRLQRQSGAFTGDLLTAGAVDVEFLGLGSASTFLVRGRIPVDSYTAVEIGFTPGSFVARDAAGADVAVTASANTLLATLPSLLTVQDGDYVRIDVDFDLLRSLSGDVALGAVTLDPEGTAVVDTGVTPLAVSDFRGIVTAADELAGTVTVDAFADDSQDVGLGSVTVNTSGTQLFLDENSASQTSTQFFGGATPGQTLIEVQGTLTQNGVVDASRIRVEDQTGGAGSVDDVRISGTVLSVGANSFTLRRRAVLDGNDVAAPILAALPDPSVLDVTFDGATGFLQGGTTLGTSAAVEVGREVDVRFCTFATTPFPACEVAVSNTTPSFRVVTTDVTGLPGSFTVNLDANDPAITGGFVQDSTTAVTVDPATADIVFGSGAQQPLLDTDITNGLPMRLQGTFGGTAAAPTFSANQVTINGGRLRGTGVTSSNQLNSSFITTGGTIVDPFGANVTPGAQQVLLEPNATFTGAATNAADFFTFLGTPQGATAEVDVHGLGTATPNEIRAFEIDTRVSGL